jgi:hypothetical protein
MVLSVVFIVAIVSAALYFWFSTKTGRKEPPGPWGLPILGYLPFMDRKMNLTLTKLAEKYGDVYQVAIGTRKIVVINGNATIKEAFAPGKSDFSGRPDFFTYSAADKSFGFCDWGPKYRALKKSASAVWECSPMPGTRTWKKSRKKPPWISSTNVNAKRIIRSIPRSVCTITAPVSWDSFVTVVNSNETTRSFEPS